MAEHDPEHDSRPDEKPLTAEDCRPKDHPEHLPWPPAWRVYPAGHAAYQKDTPAAPFNEDWARADFGDEFVDAMKEEQLKFLGDWWLLAMLVQWSEAALEADPDGSGANRWGGWAQGYGDTYLEWKHPSGFASAHLGGIVLFYARLEHVTLTNACMEGAYLPDVQLDHAVMHGAGLSQANLRRGHLRHADLRWARLDGAILQGARIEGTNFHRAHADHADFASAIMPDAKLDECHLESAIMVRADLEGANLKDAHLEKADLDGAHLTGAILTGANLRWAHLRRATGLRFDDNRVEGIRIEGNAPDPWSRLRRNYSGPLFFLHLLLLIAFFLPQVSTVMALTIQSRAEAAASEHIAAMITAADRDTLAGTGRAELGRALARAELAYTRNREPVPAADILLGLHRSPLLFAATLVVVVYNILRGLLTLKVSQLRDAEERSQTTPALAEYLWLYRIHRIGQALFLLATVSVILNIGDWVAGTMVWVSA